MDGLYLSIDMCWTPDSEIYKETQTLLVERSYRRAVDNLERLVVQRLFELTKLGMNGVGMSTYYPCPFESVLINTRLQAT